MIPRRRSFWCEFLLVPCDGSIFVNMLPPRKCHTVASDIGASSPRFLHWGEKFILVRNLENHHVMIRTSTRFGLLMGSACVNLRFWPHDLPETRYRTVTFLLTRKLDTKARIHPGMELALVRSSFHWTCSSSSWSEMTILPSLKFRIILYFGLE